MNNTHPSNLVFYDGTCGFCDHIVQFLLVQDTDKRFLFAPLQGKTAQLVLKDLPEDYKTADSLILVENYSKPDQSFYILGKSAFRILWLLGGWWALLGWINFLPAFLYNWGYRFVASNRHRFLSETCQIPTPGTKDRFLE